MSETTKWIAAILVIIAGVMYAINSYDESATASQDHVDRLGTEINQYLK